MSKTIFLVEDDQDDQEFFVEAVNKIENATLSQIAHNGQDALDKLEKESTYPDLIFMDINMPLMNGLEFIKHLRASKLFKDIPLVMLSGKDESSNKILCLRNGADDYMVKPFNPEELAIRLNKMIRRIYI